MLWNDSPEKLTGDISAETEHLTVRLEEGQGRSGSKHDTLGFQSDTSPPSSSIFSAELIARGLEAL